MSAPPDRPVRPAPVDGPGGAPVVGPDALVGGCHAPSMQLHFKPDGSVLPCCWSVRPLGNITTTRLRDLWPSPARAELVGRLAALDFSQGCQGCEAEVLLEGREGSHLAYFDDWGDRLGPDRVGTLSRIEFELSNACNLQCVQCSGEYSSAIRSHREKRPPLPRVYGDEFFEDLAPLLPGLVDTSFAGGEPFLANENVRVWDLMALHAPHVPATITTNGTIWNDLVERVLSTLVVDVIVSLDGVTPATYEAVRVGARFAVVRQHLERFRAHAQRSGRSLQLNFCLMPANVADLPDLLRFAEDLGVVVNVIPVRSPAQSSLAALPEDELATLLAPLEQADAALSSSLVLNATAWRRSLAQLRAWRAAQRSTSVTVRASTNPMLLMFPRSGAGRHDDSAARAELASRAHDGVVWSIEVDRDERMATFPEGLAHRLGARPEDLVGAHPSALLATMQRWETERESTDRVDVRCRFDAGAARAAIVAMRDDAGWCRTARILVAFVEG